MSPLLLPVATLALGVVAALPASATPVGGHCPPFGSGYVVWDVSAPAYAADDEVDAKGNGNGLVCAKAMKMIDDGAGGVFQLYNFIDDSGTGRTR